MSKYKGLFTFDVDNHRYLPVEQADGIIDCMNYYPELEMPKEPLIKDGKIRKAVRAWAEADEVANAINQQSQPVKKTYSRLDFDEVREAINAIVDFDEVRKGINAIDDEKSLDEYGAELKKKHTNMTANQAKAISEMFNKRREELRDYKADEPLIKDEDDE